MDDDKKQSGQFDASLPLPPADTPGQNNLSSNPQTSDNHHHKTSKDEEPNPAADLVRKKVAAAFASEPDPQEEGQDLIVEHDHHVRLTKHQKFIYDLTNSGKPLHEIQSAWHEYYAELPDHEKHEVWNEFYNSHAAASHYAAATQVTPQQQNAGPAHHEIHQLGGSRFGRKLYQKPVAKHPSASHTKHNSPLKSLMFGLSIGAIVLVIFLFSFFNERFIAPFIQPSRNASNTPIISGTTTISADPEIIIPKINVQIPVVYAADNSDNTIETDLESGVVHYADTAMPGQDGNLVIFGHSSNNIFNPGRYKFAFVLLSKLEPGDTFYIDKDGRRYTYEVYQREIVSPTDVNVLGLTDKPATATLITCDPPGTSTNRLVVTAEQIDPSPASNLAAVNNNEAISQTSILPGNSPTLWSRLVKWFSE